MHRLLSQSLTVGSFVLQGVAGVTGAAGDRGPTGAKGIRGSPGHQGASGQSGEDVGTCNTKHVLSMPHSPVSCRIISTYGFKKKYRSCSDELPNLTTCTRLSPDQVYLLTGSVSNITKANRLRCRCLACHVGGGRSVA